LASDTDWRSEAEAGVGLGVLLAVLTTVFGGVVAAALVVLDGGRPSWTQGLSLVLVTAGMLAILAWIARRAWSRRLRRISERSETRIAKLEAEKRLLKSVVDEMSEAVLVADGQGRTSYFNPRWRELFALADEGDRNQAPWPELRDALERLIATTLETEQEQQVELRLSDPDRRTLTLTSSPLSESRGVVLVARDATELLRLTEIRQDFVANVSHELKTPLSAIRGFAETLLDGAKEDPRASAEFLARILKQCGRLEALLSDLLTLSQMEHVAAEVRLVPVDLEEIVREAIEIVSDRITDRKLDLAVEFGASSGVAGDAVALERLCVNLLDNAVKYNREGGSIRVRLYDAGREIILEVADTGIGIPKGSERRLFERFYRVDKGRSRQEGGTGLGLAIVKHAANVHGGSVEVESELGKGSMFRVRLPKA
jgi:two-component system phosphate regulon sensor histidine kinase PhoR